MIAVGELRQLSGAQVDAFRRDGYVVVPGALGAPDTEALVRRARELIAGFDERRVRSVFTTHEQTRTSDDYFLASGDRISFFFEAEAFGPDGELRHAKEVSINKIGHALHDLDPVYSELSRRPIFADLAHDVGMRAPSLLQSMHILKPPHIGGEVTLHQDATFLYTDPITVRGLWVALEDATVGNGCLWVVPGTHRGPLRRRFRRAAAGGMEFVDLDDTPLPDRGQVPLEVERGTLVVLHGLLPHRSDANRSDTSRHAYSLHLVERDARYPTDNWLQRGDDLPLRGFE